MKIPFFLRNRRNKLVNNGTIVVENKDMLSDDNLIDSEKEQLLSNLNQDNLQYFFFRYNLDKSSISLDFVKLLVNNPELLDRLVNKYFELDIIQKINNKMLRIEDIKRYDNELFSYDIFSDEDSELLNILRNKVNITDGTYATFNFDDYERQINDSQFIDITVPSFFDEELVMERQKAIPLDRERIFIDDNVSVAAKLEEDKIFSINIFDNYYSGNLSLNKDSILFISYNKFLEWINNEDKLNVLNSVQVIIKDGITDIFELYNSMSFDGKYYKSNLASIDNIDRLVIKINHLLYLIDNSELNIEEKEVFKYKICKIFEGNKENFGTYIIEKDIKDIALELQNKLDRKDTKQLTIDFNKLDKKRKLKDIKGPDFSAGIFLRQFENLDNLSSFQFLNYITKLSEDEKNEVLSNSIVIEKLRGLLKESAKDEYKYYEKFINLLGVEAVFKIFDSDFIKNYYINNKYENKYRFFFQILEEDINYAVDYLLKDEKYFEQFIKDAKYYNFSKLDYSLLVSMLKKTEEKDLSNNLSFLGTVEKKEQLKLLKEDFGDEMLVKIVESSNKDVQQFFYLEDKRFNYLYDKFHILNLIESGYKFSDDVIRKEGFFDKLKSTSLIQFRININQFAIHQPSIFIEEKVAKYEKELISDFDKTSGMFKQYKELLENMNFLDDRNFVCSGIDFFYDSNMNFEIRKFITQDDDDKIFIKDRDGIITYLQELSKRKLNEIIVDSLFKDNIYNVFLNIKEMIRFNNELGDKDKILDEEQVAFYKMILNIDRLDKENIMEIYDKFKDKNVALMFYEDLQKVKSNCYDKIKSELFQPDKMEGKEDKEKSLEYGVSVYDLREQEYVILARCLNSSYREDTHNRRDCYTLLSNENSDVMHRDSLVYGYSGFDNDCVLHMFEGDAYSGDVKWSELNAGSDRVNRIMSSRELATNSHMYSEVQIVNKKNEDKNEMFEALRPSFLICYDEINDMVLEEAKKKNIPICIISYNRDKTLEGIIDFDDVVDKYTNERWSDKEEERRKYR